MYRVLPLDSLNNNKKLSNMQLLGLIIKQFLMKAPGVLYISFNKLFIYILVILQAAGTLAFLVHPSHLLM
ncbi:hypothetical protein EH071_03200 [Salmonella enterica]|nr:hypothetical protein [Salmonella enterica]